MSEKVVNKEELVSQDNMKENDDSNEEIVEEAENELIQDEQDDLSICQDKLKRALADYQNLEKRSNTIISNKVMQKTIQLMLDFIGIYEDFIRAKTALANDEINTKGLDGVIKNMETLLSENNVKAIQAIGEIFDPKLHEAVSIVEDDSLDEGTITQEVAKGYISFHEVIRPSKVIVSKKSKDK